MAMKMPRNFRHMGIADPYRSAIFPGCNNFCNVGLSSVRSEQRGSLGSGHSCAGVKFVKCDLCKVCKLRQKVGLDELLAMGSDC